MHAVAKKNETLPRELHTDIPTTWYFKISFRSLSQCERQLWLRLLLERQKNILERQVSNPFICSGTIRANSKKNGVYRLMFAKYSLVALI